MYFIRPTKNTAGAYPQPQSVKAPGLVELPAEHLPRYIEYSGFVELEISEGVVTSLTPNIAEYEAWKAQEEVSASVEIEDTQADTAAMLVDHEYRLTLLELGLTE